MTARALFVGLTTFDIVHTVDAAPRPDAKVQAHSTWTGAGGPATNAALTFAALGGEADLVSFVGDGPLSEAVRAELSAHRCVLHPVGGRGRLPVSSATVDAVGRRTVVSANASRFEVIDDALPAGVRNDPQIVVVDSHLPSFAATLPSFGVPVVFDPGGWKPSVELVMPYVSHVIASEQTRPDASPAVLIDELLRWPNVELAAVTRGGGSIVVRERGQELVEVPVPSITVVDSLGAGDVLHGAFAFHLLRASSAVNALADAAADAAASCTHVGARL